MRRWLYLSLLGGVVFGLAFLAGFAGWVPAPRISIEWGIPAEKQYVPSFSARSGPELAFVYIGSSTCAYSNLPGLPDIVRKLKQRVRARAAENHRSFAAIGVAEDWVIDDGLNHLEKFGRFDEVMTGRNWLNIGALKYFYEDIPGRTSTPQVLVVDRVVEGADAPVYGIRDEELVVRKVGAGEIRRWLEQDIPMPTLDPVLEPEQSSEGAER